MSHLLSGLNQPQQEAVKTINGPLLVLAGAGTGKTRVITHRMAYLIQQGVAPDNILALTFTNKAAREMKERFTSLVGKNHNPKSMRALFAGTFHSFCVRLLREFIEKLDYSKNFTIYDEADQLALLRQTLGNTASSMDLNKIKFLIGLTKNKGLSITSLTDGELAPAIFQRYQEGLKLRNAVDFDDLLLLAMRLMKEHADVREKLCQRYRYILVDEYQDTNQIQFEIVRLLASGHQNICVVGDDDQSIYSWRGAESTHILEFERYFPNAKVVKLEQNYRCTPNILKAANHVIKNNARRHLKVLWAAGADGEKIQLVNSPGEQEEAGWVVAEILKLRRLENLSWESFAILYRTNHLSRTFEHHLRQFSIPYRVIGGLAFYERREVKDVVAYLQVIMNPHDDISLLRIINNPARGIGKVTLEEMMRQARTAKHSIWQEILLQVQQPRPHAGVVKFHDLVQRYHTRFLQETTWSQVMKDLLDEINFFTELRRSSKDNNEAGNRCENVQEFVSSLAEFEQQKSGTLQDFVDHLRLDQKENKNEEKNNYGVTLMTLHSAKGLEFRYVFLVGLEEGILPHDRSKLEGNVEEERRLFYVGMTRAMRGLMLSYCDKRRRYGQEEPRHPSSFLTELPIDILEHVNANLTLTEASPAQATNRFHALKEKLRKVND